MHTEPTVKLHAPTTDATATDPAIEARAVEPPQAAKRLIRLADLFAALAVSKPTGHRLLAAGKIGPRPIRLTPACVRFDADEVNVWLATRKADGNLHDVRSWAAVWESIRKRRS
jgi:predicted DNA-binding transcriptional regulator AlpA